MKKNGWGQIVDRQTLTRLIDGVIRNNPDVVQAVKEGDKKQRGWLMGQIMGASDGKASPTISSQILDQRL